MTTQLQVTKTLGDDGWSVTFSILAGSDIPADIFMFINPGDGTLGEFKGTCSFKDIGSTPVYIPGKVIPLFGNRFIRFKTGTINSVADPDTFITGLQTNVSSLRYSYLNSRTQTQVITLT